MIKIINHIFVERINIFMVGIFIYRPNARTKAQISDMLKSRTSI